MQDNRDIYLSILDQINDIFYRTDLEGRLIMTSSSAVRILGYDSMDELLGRPFDSWCTCNADHERFEEAMKQEGGIEYIEVALKKKDGSAIYTEGTCHFYYDKDGNPMGMEGVWRDITERKKAEESLKESESKYRTIFEATGNPYFLVDWQTGQILDANQAGCRQYGYTHEEIQKLKSVDLSIEPDKTVEAFVNRDERVAIRYHKRKNGEIFPVEIVNSFYNWQGREVVLTSLREITDRLNAEKALRKSEARYRGIVESQRDIVLRTSLGGTPTYANESWTRVTGVPITNAEEGRSVRLIHPDDMPNYHKHVQILQQPPHRHYVELRIQTTAGWRWYGFETCHIFDEDGAPVDGVTVGRDIHDQKLAEAELHAHARRLGLATEAAMEGVWENNLTTGAIYLSPQAHALLGYSPEDYGTVRPENTVHPDDYGIVGRHIGEYLEGVTDRIDCEYRVITKSGEVRWVQCRGRITERDEDGNPVSIGGTITDTTDARKSREALEKAHADLQKAYCMQKEFLNCITHEIRTPLIAVKGYVDMLLEGFAGPINEKQQTYLRKIQTSSDSLLGGVTALVEMSRVKSGKVEIGYEIFAPMKLVSRVVSIMAPHAHQKGLSLRVHDLGCPCAGVTDATKVTVILNNLLANAVKFTEAGGVEAFVDSDDTGFTVAIVDTGKGMCDSDVELIFEEFEQLKTSVKYKETGFGIGLALVASLVEVLGAELTVSTAKGLGSAFTLRVPRLDPSAAAGLGDFQASDSLTPASRE